MTSKVVIVGVGALGSHVVQFMRNMDVDLTVIDMDTVEMKNVASQFHAKGTVRKKKVEGLKQSMNFLFGTRLQTIPHKLTNDNVEQLLGGADLVVDCLDNAEARTCVQDFCSDEHIPCLHGALDGAGSFGRVIWSENFQIDAESAEGQATCEDGQFLPFIAITAAHVARAAQRFIEDDKRIGYTIHPGGVMAT